MFRLGAFALVIVAGLAFHHRGTGYETTRILYYVLILAVLGSGIAGRRRRNSGGPLGPMGRPGPLGRFGAPFGRSGPRGPYAGPYDGPADPYGGSTSDPYRGPADPYGEAPGHYREPAEPYRAPGDPFRLPSGPYDDPSAAGSPEQTTPSGDEWAPPAAAERVVPSEPARPARTPPSERRVEETGSND